MHTLVTASKKIKSNSCIKKIIKLNITLMYLLKFVIQLSKFFTRVLIKKSGVKMQILAKNEVTLISGGEKNCACTTYNDKVSYHEAPTFEKCHSICCYEATSSLSYVFTKSLNYTVSGRCDPSLDSIKAVTYLIEFYDSNYDLCELCRRTKII